MGAIGNGGGRARDGGVENEGIAGNEGNKVGVSDSYWNVSLAFGSGCGGRLRCDFYSGGAAGFELQGFKRVSAVNVFNGRSLWEWKIFFFGCGGGNDLRN